MKALEKDRNRRYESASALAADVQRYLADEPVQACPPSVGYRLRKYAKRNKGLLSTLSLIGATLLIATGVSLWHAYETDKARDEAVKARKLADDRYIQLEEEHRRAKANFSKCAKRWTRCCPASATNDSTTRQECSLCGRNSSRTRSGSTRICLEVDPNDAALRVSIAHAKLAMRNIYLAEGDLEKATNAARDSVEILEKLVAEMRKQSRVPCAARSSIQVLQLEPDGSR